MVFVFAIAEFDAFEELVGDVRIARGRAKSREPIEPGDDAVLDRARLDVSRPTSNARDAEAAFHDGAFRGAEGRHAAVGPGEDFSAVVGGEDDNRVVGFADV